MQEPSKTLLAPLALAILLAASLVYTAYYAQQHTVWRIYGGIACSGVAYWLLLRRPNGLSVKAIVLLGLTIRVAMLGAMPQLSDDYFRFVWDGRLIHQGIAPYTYLPSEVLALGLHSIDSELYASLNSPNYYSVYPPVSQVLYWLSSWPGLSIEQSVSLLRLLHIGIEGLGLGYFVRLLHGLARSSSEVSKLAGYYYLCPLVIIEGVGNLHHEPLTMSMVLVTLYYLTQSRWARAGVSVIVGVGIKLIPLMLLPYVLLRLEGRARWVFGTAVGLSAMVLLSPLLTLDASNFMSSLDLYFRRFEFNASLYYLLRAVGLWITGYNLIAYIGPLLGLIPVVYCLRASIRDASKGIDVVAISCYALMALTLYYLCATTVHPWYIINLLPLALLAGWRYPLLWALLIPLTYINYSADPYKEYLLVVAIEYCIVAVAIYLEWSQQKKGPSPESNSPF